MPLITLSRILGSRGLRLTGLRTFVFQLIPLFDMWHWFFYSEVFYHHRCPFLSLFHSMITVLNKTGNTEETVSMKIVSLNNNSNFLPGRNKRWHEVDMTKKKKIEERKHICQIPQYSKSVMIIELQQAYLLWRDFSDCRTFNFLLVLLQFSSWEVPQLFSLHCLLPTYLFLLSTLKKNMHALACPLAHYLILFIVPSQLSFHPCPHGHCFRF